MDRSPSQVPSSPRRQGPQSILPMRVEIRLWNLDFALLLDAASFDVAREQIGCEHSENVSPHDAALVDRTKPAVTVEVRFDQSVAAESRLHSPVASNQQPAVQWGNSPLRSQLASCPLKEVMIFSLHPSAIEGSVEIRLYQWASLQDRAPPYTPQDANADGMCSVSEQGDTEHMRVEAAVRMCIGTLKVPLRKILLQKQVRLKLHLVHELRREAKRFGEPISSAMSGSDLGGVAAVSLHMSAVYFDCVMPTALTHPLLSNVALPNANPPSPSGLSSTSGGSQSGSSTAELRLLLSPVSVVHEVLRAYLKIALWKKPSATIAMITCALISYLFDLVHITAVVMAISGTLFCRRALQRATQVSLATVDHEALLYPSDFTWLNAITRGHLWLRAGHSDETFLEVMQLGSCWGRRVSGWLIVSWIAVLFATLASLETVLLWTAVFLLFVYPILHIPLLRCTIRRRPAGSTSRLLFLPWRVVFPEAWCYTPLPITRIVKAVIRPVDDRGALQLPLLRRDSSVRRESAVLQSTIDPDDNDVNEVTHTLNRPRDASSAVDGPNIVIGGSDLRSDTSPPLPKPDRRSSFLPPAPPLSTRAQKRESASTSVVSAENQQPETPRRRLAPGDSSPMLTRRHSAGAVGMLASDAKILHRRTHSHVAPAPSHSFAVVSVEWKEDGLSDLGGKGIRTVYGANNTANSVKERILQFYRKVEALEQHLQGDVRSATLIDSSTSFTGNHGTQRMSSSSSTAHDHITSEATLLLLHLRRIWKTATVRISTGSIPEGSATFVERLERIAHPGSLVEQVQGDVVTNTLVSGQSQLLVSRLMEVRGLDENCRAWALLCMSLLNGLRMSLYIPHGYAKTSFLVPLTPNSVMFDATSGTASCPPPIIPALQDLWRGWQEGSRDQPSLVTLDVILTIICAQRDYWKHHISSSSATLIVVPPTQDRTGRRSPQGKPPHGASPKHRSEPSMDATGRPMLMSPNDTVLSATPLGEVNDSSSKYVKTPIDSLAVTRSMHRVVSSSPTMNESTNPLSTDADSTYEPASTKSNGTRLHRNVYASLGIGKHQLDAARGVSPPPRSPSSQVRTMEMFPPFNDKTAD